MYPYLSRQRRWGVTLIEILVALAVLAVLLALLIPTTLSVSGTAKSVQCCNHLRSIGSAIHTYIAENDGYYPYGRSNPEPNDKFLFRTLRDAGIDTYRGDGKSYQKAGIWYCPADTERDPDYAPQSYGVNFHLGASRDSPKTPAWQKKLAALGNQNLIYLMDHDSGVKPRRTGGNLQETSWPLRNNAPQTPPSSGVQVEFRHSGASNALFVDGSVRSMRWEELRGTGRRYIKAE